MTPKKKKKKMIYFNKKNSTLTNAIEHLLTELFVILHIQVRLVKRDLTRSDILVLSDQL